MEREESVAAGNLSKFELPLARRPPATKKRGGAISLLRAATFLVRRRSESKKAAAARPREDAVDSGADDTWRSLVCGIRPLHHHQLPGSPPPPPPIPFAGHESFHDVLSPRSSVDGMSRYASAEDLRALDTSEGDDAVDGKAEEFIARFYEQMRLQRMESSNLEMM